MIRVLHIGMSENLGGIETFIFNFYKEIDKRQFQFDFVNMYNGNICYEREILQMGGKIYKIPNEKIHPIKFKKELQKIIINNKYTIVHIHKNSLAFNTSIKALKNCGVKMRIIHSHNIKSTKDNLIVNLLHYYNKRNTEKYCNYFFACSQKAGEWLYTSKILSSNNYFILNNAIDINKFKYNLQIRKEVRQNLNIAKNTTVLGHVGRFDTQKNHTFLLDVFYEYHKMNSNSILLLVGQGPLESKIKEKVKKLGLVGAVKFLGKRNDVNKLYQAFDIFLFPSLYEGLGMVLIEAQCAGLSCISSTEVPKTAKILDTIDFVSLNQTSKNWAKKIDNFAKITNTNRPESYKVISQKGFNIKQEVVKLQNLYLCGLEQNSNE